MHLQKRNRQANDAVTPQSSTEHLVHRALTQERLNDEHERTKGRKFLEKPEDHFSSENAIGLVDVNVDRDAAMDGDEFDDGNSSLRYDRHVIRNP